MAKTWIDQLDDEQLDNLIKIRDAATKYGVDPKLAVSLAMRESGLRNLKSDVDKYGRFAFGPMQLRQDAATDMKVDRFNVDQNIDGGVRYLKQHMDTFKDRDKALHAYRLGANHSSIKEGVTPGEVTSYISGIDKYINEAKQTAAPAKGGKEVPPLPVDQGAGAGDVQIADISSVDDWPNTSATPQSVGTSPTDAIFSGGAGALLGMAAAPSIAQQEREIASAEKAAEKANKPIEEYNRQQAEKFAEAQELRNRAMKAFEEKNNLSGVPKYVESQVKGPSTNVIHYDPNIITNQQVQGVIPGLAESHVKARQVEPQFVIDPNRGGLSVPPQLTAAPPPSVEQIFPPVQKPTPRPLEEAKTHPVKSKAQIGMAPGFFGGVNAADAMTAYQNQDPLSAAIATTGTVAGGVAPTIRNPRARLGLTALSAATAGAQRLRNKYLESQQQEVPTKADGGLVHLQGGGSPKRQLAGKALDTAAGLIGRQPSGLFVPRETQIMRMSEALGPHEGKYFNLTQSDNFGVHGGRMGGNQFPNFQNILPRHQQANAVWMNDAEKHANALVNNRKIKGKDTVYSTYIGAPDQLKSNKTVTNDILEQHYGRELTPEQIDLINNRIATVKDSKGNLIFPQAFDIRDRFATQELGTDTFARRGALASMLGAGEGVGKTRGGIALPQYESILRSHRDPLTEGVPTSSVGTRLFTVDDAPAIYTEDFHPDYRWLVTGKDQQVQFPPVPQRLAVFDWYNKYKAEHPTREPHGNAWFSYPKDPQFIDDKYLTRLQKEGYAEGGLTHLQEGGSPKKKMLRYFVDPATKYLSDWNWKGMPEVSSKLNLREVPDYIQGGYGDFMKEQAKRAAAGDLTARDLIKAYTITQSSIGRGGLSHATATKAGLKIPNTGNEVRPEGAFAEWLGSPSGQKYLDMAARGEVDPKTLAEIQQQFAPFGKQNDLIQKMQYAAETMPGVAKDLNQAIVGDKDAYRKWAEQMKGVAGAKSGFIGSMLGRGDLPTFDARQITLHTGNQAPVGIGSIMNRGKGQGGREAVDRLAARQEALGLDIDPSLDPFYQHLTHHAVWDKVGDNKTTHDDLVKAMRNYAEGGLAHLQAGGSPKKEIITRLGTHAYDMLGLTPEKVAAWKSANIKPNKQQQDPVLAKAVDAYLNKQISQADYLRIMNERRPIRPLTAVPAGHTNEDIVSALLGPQVEKGILGLNAHVPEGTRVGNRLDIPAYERYGIYVDTMHDPAGKKPIAYGHTGHLKDVQFSSSPTRSARIGLGTREQELTPMAKTEGTGKSPFAMMVGNQVNTSDEEVRRMLKEYLRDPEWHQIGMNPYRASQFYDKSDMRPVWSAKEKLQAGPLVLARDIEKSDWTDPRLMTDFGVNYKEGGLTGLYANIHAKRERIKHGSGEKMRKPGSPGAPTADAFEESAKTAKLKDGGTPSLSVGRGEKLSTDQGAGLTAKGRAKYNRETGSNLKAPQPEGGARKDSFCARMQGVVDHAKGDAPRAKASLKRWNC
jgi:hypothetical protein